MLPNWGPTKIIVRILIISVSESKRPPATRDSGEVQTDAGNVINGPSRPRCKLMMPRVEGHLEKQK